MTSICLVRHGETDWNKQGRLQGKTDIPLNSHGRQQAKECQQYLKGTEWDVLITSPLSRAKKTAEIINEELQLPLVEMEEFIERTFGEAEGMTAEERRTAFADTDYPGKETIEALNQRVLAGIEKIKETYPQKKVLLVAHGAVIGAILSYFSYGETDAGKEKLLNACISNIDYQQERWNIRDYNQVSHLSAYREKAN